MKRQLLDQLAARHDFAVPQSMVDAEFEHIWHQLATKRATRPIPKAALAEIEKRRRRISPASPSAACASACCCREIGAGQRRRGQRAGNEPADRPGRAAISGPRTASASSATSSRSRWPPPSCARRCTRTRSSTSCSPRPRSPSARRPAPSSRPTSRCEEGHVHGPGCGHDHAEPSRRRRKAAKKPRPRSAGQAPGRRPRRLLSRKAGEEACPRPKKAAREEGPAKKK